MAKNNYTNVLKNVFVHTRDNAVTGIWHYYFILNGKPYRGTTGTTDLDEAKMVAITKFQLAKTNSTQQPAKKVSRSASMTT